MEDNKIEGITGHPEQVVKFLVKPKSIGEKIKTFLGFGKYELGFFHCTGYDSNFKQNKSNKPNIAIIEKQDGHVVTVKNNDRNYKFIKG